MNLMVLNSRIKNKQYKCATQQRVRKALKPGTKNYRTFLYKKERIKEFA